MRTKLLEEVNDQIIQCQMMTVCLDGEPKLIEALYVRRPNGKICIALRNQEQLELYKKARRSFRSGGDS